MGRNGFLPPFRVRLTLFPRREGQLGHTNGESQPESCMGSSRSWFSSSFSSKMLEVYPVEAGSFCASTSLAGDDLEMRKNTWESFDSYASSPCTALWDVCVSVCPIALHTWEHGRRTLAPSKPQGERRQGCRSVAACACWPCSPGVAAAPDGRATWAQPPRMWHPARGPQTSEGGPSGHSPDSGTGRRG